METSKKKQPDLAIATEGAPLEEQFYYAFVHDDDERCDAILKRMDQTPSPRLSVVQTRSKPGSDQDSGA